MILGISRCVLDREEVGLSGSAVEKEVFAV